MVDLIVRVAYVSKATQVSGAERSLQAILTSARTAEISPLFVCPPGDPLLPWSEAHGIPVVEADSYHRDFLHPFRWRNSVRRLRAILKAHNVDVVHANHLFCYPTAGAAGRRGGAVRVCHMRNELGPTDATWWCKDGVEGVICISKHVEAQVRATWPRTRRFPAILTILNSVALPDWGTDRERDDRSASARQVWSISPDAVVFGFIGQLIPLKGVTELLDACAGLPPDIPWILLIAGRDPAEGAPYERLCRERAARLGIGDRVKFLGYLQDVGPFYAAVQAVIVPSLEEPLGRVPLEAAAHGKPSIAFAVGGLPETIQHHATGWLVPVNDVTALRATMREFLEHPATVMGQNARRMVEAVGHPDRYVQALANFYRQLLENRRAGA
jgi:glycosyltransferase involved in cell wall biosynthesis